jgi:hypothetical protein
VATEIEEIANVLRGLEERLLQPSVRSSPDQVSRLIADDFVEFGSSGRAYDKDQIVALLAEEQPQAPLGQSTIHEFEVRMLAEGVTLITYRSMRAPSDSSVAQFRRSSVWKIIEGRWQMVFHQGTPIPPES